MGNALQNNILILCLLNISLILRPNFINFVIKKKIKKHVVTGFKEVLKSELSLKSSFNRLLMFTNIRGNSDTNSALCDSNHYIIRNSIHFHCQVTISIVVSLSLPNTIICIETMMYSNSVHYDT